MREGVEEDEEEREEGRRLDMVGLEKKNRAGRSLKRDIGLGKYKCRIP